ncbi:phenylacetic acid degradation protein [Burkholderia ubonensis]|uniref:PaaI family thioesterase n=1 Tax=Burkholderia ubonensis TaxID=101571 RepID=UPI0007599BA7|nr:PaaI family thioesterase [Burkholderia ubonensis]KVG74974.1 phenylacetic acid degradation protein [Burkholderia ubonensis]KVH21607.1 phenylacetic acid degradation protein [Burkholderia ubonensis]KVH50109.1 phenylacetic acid degradation protein [Burkholderia ubonensis]KVH87250.1 phenylacetic acid degradation protein [Burkholderia ubonensis]KVM37572.1 phenylacetic acid degradation protein [Burkholderia ubonensis]
MNPLSMSGIELLRAAAVGDVPLASISETMPMRPLKVELGYVKMAARADGRHLNPLGGVHGGFAATVLDSVTGCAVHSMLDAGVGYGTVDLHVKMLRPVPRDVELIAEGRVIHLSRSLGVAEGTLKTPDDKIVAHASATCFIQRPQ